MSHPSVRPRLRRCVVVGVAAAASLALTGGVAVAGPSDRSNPDRSGERNVIVIIGDGMGYNSVDVGSLYEHGASMYQSTRDNPHLAGPGGPRKRSQVYQDFPT